MSEEAIGRELLPRVSGKGQTGIGERCVFMRRAEWGKINDTRELDGRWFATTSKHSPRQRMEV